MEPSIRTVGSMLVRRLPAVLALIGAVIGLAISSLLPVSYVARTSLLVGESLRNVQLAKEDVEASRQLAQLYAALVREQPVLEGVARRIGARSWHELQDRIHASVTGGNKQLIVVSGGAPSSAEALEIARAVPIELQGFLAGPLDAGEASRMREYVWSRVIAAQDHIQDSDRTITMIRLVLARERSQVGSRTLRARIGELRDLQQRWLQSHTDLTRLLHAFSSPGSIDVIESPTVDGGPLVRTPATISFLAVAGFAAGLGGEAFRRARLRSKGIVSI